MPTRNADGVLSYSPEQLFDLVADVERYPEFVPGWVAARVERLDEETYATDQMVRFRALRRRFSSRTVLSRPERIDIHCQDKAFRRFDIHWSFDRLDGEGCRVRVSMDYEFRSRALQKLLGELPGTMTESMIGAFAQRASQLYGPRKAGAQEIH